LSKSSKHLKNRFELESLEPRVLLSADAFLAAASGAAGVNHSVEVAHQISPSSSEVLHAGSVSQSVEVGGIFEGISAQPIQSHESAAVAKTPSADRAGVTGAQANATSNVVVLGPRSLSHL